MKAIKNIKFKQLLLKNFPLKLLAIVIAIVVWIVIVNIDNPAEKVTIANIGVDMLNGDVLTGKGYIYSIDSGGTLAITVRGPKSVTDELKASDFYAYADLSERTPTSSQAKIHVECTNSEVAKEIDIIDQKTEYVQLSIDNEMEAEFELQVELTGEPADGYVVGDYSISPTTIKVSGAEAVVSSIDSAKIVYNVDNMTADIEDSVKPVFYDANGSEINIDKLELNRDSVKIKIEILQTKTVHINYQVSGEPASGFAITANDSNIDSVTIAGSKDALSGISSIDIPSELVSVEGLSESTIFEINLEDYLADDCRIISEVSKLQVEVSILKIGAATVAVSMADITIQGMDEDEYEYSITNTRSLSVQVSGLENDIAGLTAADLAPEVDVSGKGEGNFFFTVSFKENEAYTIVGTYRVKVSISRIEEEETETEPESETESENSGDEETESEEETEEETEPETEPSTEE